MSEQLALPKLAMSQHFAELRSRILSIIIFFFLAFALCYYFASDIYHFLLQPFIDISPQGRKLIFTAPSEVFFSYLRLAFYASLFFSIPLSFCQLYLFLSPALYQHEKKLASLVLIFAPLFFIAGAMLAYYFIIPIALQFFASYENSFRHGDTAINMVLETKVSNYLDFVIDLLIGFGLAFLTPIAMLLLLKSKIISIEAIKKKRRYFIVAIFIISAILTPPDVFSQLILAIIMILLLELVLFFAKFYV
jgi:sec-independent protein translocase protein TatC